MNSICAPAGKWVLWNTQKARGRHKDTWALTISLSLDENEALLMLNLIEEPEEPDI